jgi:serine/threonine protein kinase
MNENEWFIDHREITMDYKHILGRGQFATVYKGKWRFVDVAVKKFNPECQPKDRVHLQKEMDILVKMHHPHIVQILGVCWNPFMLILEYMPRGNLRDALKRIERYPSCFNFSLKKKWSIQLCVALIYLHERKPQYVIHRDIKPTNVLIDQYGNLKISDFGISKLMDVSLETCSRSVSSDLCTLEHSSEMTKNIGTLYYTAPEILDPTIRHYDNRVDLWSLGCTLYELWENLYLRNQCTVDQIYTQLWEPDFMYTPRILRPLIEACLDVGPHNRPEARALLDILYQVSFWKW